MFLRAGLKLNVRDRKISNTSIRKMFVTSSFILQKNEPAKKIMAYTGHRSLSIADTMDHKAASYINL